MILVISSCLSINIMRAKFRLVEREEKKRHAYIIVIK